MKKIFSLIICLAAFMAANAQLQFVDDKLELYSDMQVDGVQLQKNQFSANLEWPKLNGQKVPEALIRVQYDGIAPDEIKRIIATVNPGNPIKAETMNYDGLQETWIYVPLNSTTLTISHPMIGQARVKLPEQMRDGDTYIAHAFAESLLPIEITPLTNFDQPVRITLDGKEEAMSPAQFNNVRTGTHTLTVPVDGRFRDINIIVTPTNTKFTAQNVPELDLRSTKDITINSSTGKGIVSIDGKEQPGAMPLTVKLPYGNHNIVVKDGANADEKSITVNASSSNSVFLSPLQMKTFEIVTMFNGDKAAASLYSPDLKLTDEQSKNSASRTFNLPVGNTYRFVASYGRNRARKNITVTPQMSSVQEIKIRGGQRIVWPWERDLYHRWGGVSFGYVEKQLQTTFEEETPFGTIKDHVYENGVWDDGYNHSLHGFQFGLHFSPTLKIGLGFYTGLFWELYMSRNDEGIGDLDRYVENDLYLPLHALYHLPFSNNVSVDFHCGLGYNIALTGVYRSKSIMDDTYDENTDAWRDEFWGEPGWPKRSNLMLEFGLGLQLGPIQLSAQISRGMNDHKSYSSVSGSPKTYQNKKSISLSFVFGSGDDY